MKSKLLAIFGLFLVLPFLVNTASAYSCTINDTEITCPEEVTCSTENFNISCTDIDFNTTELCEMHLQEKKLFKDLWIDCQNTTSPKYDPQELTNCQNELRDKQDCVSQETYNNYVSTHKYSDTQYDNLGDDLEKERSWGTRILYVGVGAVACFLLYPQYLKSKKEAPARREEFPTRGTR